MIKLLVAILFLLILSGCEGRFQDKHVSDSAIEMLTGVTYQVFPGDEVVPGAGANITVNHILSNDTKFVTLNSGSADLLRGDYVLK